MDRLKSLARSNNQDFNLLLVRFANERLLYRLAQSPYAGQFTLKGAMLFALWEDQPHRPTRDIDLLGFGEDSDEHMQAVFRDVCTHSVEPDGLVFEPESVSVSAIREGQAYQGKRVEISALLGKARMRVQVDVGFGDALAAPAEIIEFPTLLPLPAPRLLAYPAEAVIAEKVHAMATLGLINSRMKDLYDVHALSQQLVFEGALLVAALEATFARRGTAPRAQLPQPLTEEFASNLGKITQWNAFVSRSRLISQTLAQVVVSLEAFVAPPYLAFASSRPFRQRWTPPGPWRATS